MWGRRKREAEQFRNFMAGDDDVGPFAAYRFDVKMPPIVEPTTQAADDDPQAQRPLQVDLLHAIEREQLDLAYRPLYALEPEALIGFEALVRWRHPSRGDLALSYFGPFAEEMAPIGEWILGTACCDAAAWPETLSVAVNLAPSQLRDPGLLASVAATLKMSRLHPARLVLEMNEIALLDDTDSVLSLLQALRALGVTIAMANFATSYESIKCLQQFPFDLIKIDPIFLRDSVHTADYDAFVHAVTALCANLGARTIAERTPQQIARSRASGFDSVRGYSSGRPLDTAGVI